MRKTHEFTTPVVTVSYADKEELHGSEWRKGFFKRVALNRATKEPGFAGTHTEMIDRLPRERNEESYVFLIDAASHSQLIVK